MIQWLCCNIYFLYIGEYLNVASALLLQLSKRYYKVTVYNYIRRCTSYYHIIS